MNSTKRFSRKDYSSAPYFRYYMKHNIYQLALFLVITALTMVVPCIIEMGKRRAWSNAFDITDYGVIGFVLSGFMGLFCGMTALSYVNNKQNITLMHSFPLKRTSLFFCETPSGVLYYLISITAGFASLLMLSGIGNATADKKMLLAQYLASVALFLLIHSAALLAGGLSGTGVIRFLMTAMVLFFPVMLYGLIVFTFNVGNSAIDSDYYMSKTVVSLLCPSYTLLDVFINGETIRDVLTAIPKTLPYTALHYVGAILLHNYRRTEDTGKTIIWKPVFVIVKYAVIFAGALLGIIVFGSSLFMGNTGSQDKVFGAVIGLVTSFILVNSVMYRSIRSLFKGLKPFIAMSVCTLVFTLLVPINAFNFIGRMYSESNTKSFDVTVDGVEVTLPVENYSEVAKYVAEDYDPYSETVSVPAIWSDNDEEFIKDNFNDYTDDENYYIEDQPATVIRSYYTSRTSLRIVQNPKIGMPKAYEAMVAMNGELWKAITATDEYKASMDISTKVTLDNYAVFDITIGGYNAEISSGGECDVYDDDGNGEYRELTDEEKATRDDLIKKLLAAAVYDRESVADNPVLGTISINMIQSGMRSYIVYPISAGNLELVNAAYELAAFAGNTEFTPYSSIEDCYKAAAEKYDCAAMVDTKTGEARRISTDKLTECMGYTASPNYFVSDYQKFVTPGDEGYILLVKMKNGYNNEILFREGTNSDGELTKLFDSLK